MSGPLPGTGGIRKSNLHAEVQVALFGATSGEPAQISKTPGVKAVNVLRVAASVVEGETVTIGGNVFEVDIINTDSTANTSGGNLNNTTDAVLVTHAAHGRAAGDLIRVENEIMKILRVIDANSYVVARGRCGTAVAAHADGLDIFWSATPPAANIPVGLVATLTPAVFTPALVAEIINALTAGSKERATAKASTIYPIVTAVSLQTGGEMLLEAVSVGAQVTATTETLAGVNNAWAAAAMYGGRAAGKRQHELQSRVPLAEEVALGFIRFSFPFTPARVLIDVRVTATGVGKAWDGGFAITGGRVALDNAGVTDWAATDTVYVYAEE